MSTQPQQLSKAASRWSQPLRLLGFVLWYSWQFVLANFHVALEVIRLRPSMTPGVLRYRMDSTSQAEIATVVSLISLTPGTLTLDLDPDTRLLIVHGMFAQSREHLTADLRELEHRFLHAFRPDGWVG